MGRYTITKADLDAAKSEVTDEMFFTSSNYHRFLRSIMEGIVNGEYSRLEIANRGKLGIRSKLAADRKQRFGGFLLSLEWDPDSETTGYCTPDRIHINAANHYGNKNLSRKAIHRLVAARMVHEVAHFLYTDFIDHRVWMNQLERKKWHPEVPEALLHSDAGLALMNAMNDPQSLKLVCKLGQEVWNRLEDGYAELRVKTENPGYPREALDYKRKMRVRETVPLSEQLKMTRTDKVSDQVPILSQVLHCSLYGEYNLGDDTTLDDEIMEVLDELYFPILEARTQKNVLKRTAALNEVMAFLGASIEDLLDDVNQQKQNQGQGGGLSQEDIEQLIEQILQNSGGDGDGDADGADQQSQAPQSHSVANAIGTDDEGSVQQKDSTGGSGGQEDGPDSDGDDGVQVAQAGQDEPGSSSGGHRGGGLPSMEDIDRMLQGLENSLEKDIAKKKASERQTYDLQNDANSMQVRPDFGDPNYKIHRDIEVSDTMKAKYESYLNGNRGHIDSMCREVLAAVEPRREGRVFSGNMLGKTVSKRAFGRFDARIFNRKVQQITSPKIAVGCVVDCSGSVCSILDHLLRTGVIIESFCDRLDIPLQLFGYTDSYDSGRSVVDIFSAVEYEKADENDKYRIMSLVPTGGTPTAAATLYAVEGLEKRPEETKLLIVMSDGGSSDNTYRGSSAANDGRYGNTGRPISDLVQYAREKGIVVIAFGVGSQAHEVGAEFGYENFVDMSNPATMPEEVAKLIAENVVV